MEGLFVLIASLLGLAVFAGPIFSALGWVRTRDTRKRVDELRLAVDALERRVQELGKCDVPRAAPAPARAVTPTATTTAGHPPQSTHPPGRGTGGLLTLGAITRS